MTDTKCPGLDLTVVLPVYNNAPTLSPLCAQLTTVIEEMGLGFELLFVNDASEDSSAERLKALSQQHDEVSVLELSRNMGQHIAVLFGLQYACGEVCVAMDADLQDPPSALPLLWRARSKSVSAIFGGRRGRFQSLARHLTSRLYKTVQHMITGLPMDAGMFVLIERPLVDELIELKTRRPWIPAAIGCLGVKTISIPIDRQRRTHGHSSYRGLARLRSGLKAIASVFEYRFWPAKQSYLSRCEPTLVSTFTPARIRRAQTRLASRKPNPDQRAAPYL